MDNRYRQMPEEQGSVKQPKSPVDHRLVKGMSDDERKKFEGAYLRSKRVLKRLNELAEVGTQHKLDLMNDPAQFQVPAHSEYIAWCAGFRNAMQVMQQLTRT